MWSNDAELMGIATGGQANRATITEPDPRASLADRNSKPFSATRWSILSRHRTRSLEADRDGIRDRIEGECAQIFERGDVSSEAVPGMVLPDRIELTVSLANPCGTKMERLRFLKVRLSFTGMAR
ncbi:hypothetical protein [Bradyrhizobium sp. AUGA SZCCT0177]|uniref:hypothetical protein n=1 Tax=Bradyrhizobium sp. AUGA SZCCT0177 TaxID=2807665 RepID=UPI001BA69E4C|nr:hypothetical protein [Bradyrhizobium sp. AUGA SZCCT0177]